VVAVDGGRIRVNLGSVSNAMESTTLVNDGNWHHVVAVWGGDTGAITLYINGAIEYTGAQSGNVTSTRSIYLGAMNEGAAFNFFDGEMANIYVFDRELNADEVSILYEQGR
ncbi:MAG: LamG-like jellyroll fold domain-containing protein, partial [Planctomycetota bacterium]